MNSIPRYLKLRRVCALTVLACLCAGQPALRASAQSQESGAKDGAKGVVVPAGAAKAAAAQSAKPAVRPVGVEVATATRRLIREEISAVGTLRAAESVMIRPEVSGRIDQIRFRNGQVVKKGDPLFSLDAAVVAAELDQARAELDLARSNLKRTRELATERFISDRSRDEAESSMRVLEAKLKVVQARLGKTRIQAPFAGVLGLRKVSVGDYVNVGADLVLIEDLSAMQVDLRLPERYLGAIAPGQDILLSLDAYPDRVLRARLVAMDAQVDANGRALLVRGQLDPTDIKLRTGMYARARLVTGESPNAVVVPEEAVVAADRGAFVYRVRGDVAERIEVRTGHRDAGAVEVLAGLAAGDEVVVAGQLKLRGERAAVTVQRPAPAPAAGAR